MLKPSFINITNYFQTTSYVSTLNLREKQEKSEPFTQSTKFNVNTVFKIELKLQVSPPTAYIYQIQLPRDCIKSH